MARRAFYVVIFFFAFCKTQAQSFVPLCRNFGPEDYNEEAEFRCATTDNKGTIYFGTNYGIFIYKGEKRSSGKNWSILKLPAPDIIYALYYDSLEKRLYVGGQHDFGYFQMRSYSDGDYVSIKGPMPDDVKKGVAEAWHIERDGDEVVFHTVNRLFFYQGRSFGIAEAPPGGIFHNVFRISDNALLANSLDKGWSVFKGEKQSGAKFKLPADKCYAVLADKEPNSFLFFLREQGVWRVTDPEGNVPVATKISDNALDKLFFDKQIYCAAFSSDKTKIIIGTLNGGTLLFDYNGKLEAAGLISEMQTATGILCSYSLFTDAQRNTWILGKNGVSRLPAELTLMQKDLRGIIVKSLLVKENELLVAADNGLYRLQKQNGIFSSAEKISEGKFLKAVGVGDAVYACTGSEVISVKGKDVTRFAAPTPINNIAAVNNALWISSQTGVYIGCNALQKDESFLSDKNILQCAVQNGRIFLLADNEGLLEYDPAGKVVKEYKLNEDFSSTQNARLFPSGEAMFVSNLKGTYCLQGDKISSSDSLGNRLWMMRSVSNGNVLRFEFDIDNYSTLWLKEKNKNEFLKVNGFMSPVEINDAEFDGTNYYLASKNGLFISGLSGSVGKENVVVVKVKAGSQFFSADEEIRIPYDSNRAVIAFCSLNSFYDSYPNTVYYYNLKGYDDSWKNQLNSEISFSNLPWGKYSLQVYARYGNQNETPVASLNFTILKPWWATWWAIVLWIFLFLLFIYAIVQISIFRLKRSKIKLEKIVDERTAEVVQQKDEIAAQKGEIELKNHEIMDSINYAKRIQTSLLKDENKFSAFLPGAFVLYLPKDIVSGDFYWFAEIGEHKMIAVADCTGHGVPGAFMSMLGVAKLNELAAKNIHSPDALLNQLNHLIVETLGQNIANSDSRDGMDIAVVSINTKAKKLYYAGANRPLFIVNNLTKSLSEIKPTKLPVGGGQYGDNREYQVHEVAIEKGLSFYLTTDGYADQFGGPKGKKMMSKRLQEFLTEISADSPSSQGQSLKKMYYDWKGHLEQVDDVCIIGINFSG